VADPFADSPEFQRLICGETDVRPARIALEIARGAYPDLEIDGYPLSLRGLADRIRARRLPDATTERALAPRRPNPRWDRDDRTL
jgi:hypothetical protein